MVFEVDVESAKYFNFATTSRVDGRTNHRAAMIVRNGWHCEEIFPMNEDGMQP